MKFGQLNAVEWFLNNAAYLENILDISTKNTSMFNTLCAIKQAEFHLPSTIITIISLFGYVIYSSDDANFQQCQSAEE